MPNRAAISAALSFALAGTAAGEIQLLPAGAFAARDGRPGDGLRWRLDPQIAARVIERFAARRNPAVIDYEHQTVYAAFKDGAAPAAGWFDGLRYDDTGLWATGVRWTARAREMIEADEYRYISAVFSFLPDSLEVLEIHHAGLTNDPALDGLAEVFEHRAAARFLPPHPQEETLVDKTALCAALGLPDTATDAEINERLTALSRAEARITELEAAQAALSAGGAPDPAQFAPIDVVESLSAELAQLRAAQSGREIDELVSAALEDGRLLPQQESWARDLGAADIARLRSYLDSAAPITALRGGQTRGRQPAAGPGPHGLSEQQLAICRNCGLDPADYAHALGITKEEA